MLIAKIKKSKIIACKKMGPPFFILAITAFTHVSCDQNNIVSTKPKILGRSIASEMPEEQKIDLNHFSKNALKFPLPYYLVPEEDAKYIFSSLLDPRVADQLSLKISGKKHYKLFVHPDAESFYEVFARSYNYIGPDLTEFDALAISKDRILIIWNRNNSDRKPFIAKVKLDKSITGKLAPLISENKIVLEGNGKNDFNYLNISPASAGLTVDKSKANAPSNIGNQLIFEIDD